MKMIMHTGTNPHVSPGDSPGNILIIIPWAHVSGMPYSMLHSCRGRKY